LDAPAGRRSRATWTACRSAPAPAPALDRAPPVFPQSPNAVAAHLRKPAASRFRGPHHCAAPSLANLGIEGHWQL